MYSFLTAEKMYKLPEMGGGGGGEIGAMPERKHSFSQEVFPKSHSYKHKYFWFLFIQKLWDGGEGLLNPKTLVILESP